MSNKSHCNVWAWKYGSFNRSPQHFFLIQALSVFMLLWANQRVCGVEVQWEEINSVAEFKCDPETGMGSAWGFSKDPEQRECLVGFHPRPSRRRLERWPAWGSYVSFPSALLPGAEFPERAVASDAATRGLLPDLPWRQHISEVA